MTFAIVTHPIAQCVDLRATFAGRFRFDWDESYAAERPEFRAIESPWLTIIPGKYGQIFPYGLSLRPNFRIVRPRADEVTGAGEVPS